jgi:hypothetical protein
MRAQSANSGLRVSRAAKEKTDNAWPRAQAAAFAAWRACSANSAAATPRPRRIFLKPLGRDHPYD